MLAIRTLGKTLTLGALAASLALTATPSLAAPVSSAANPPPDVPGNLINNPGFEAPYVKQCCHEEPGFPPNLPVDEVQVPAGWRGWWRQPAFPNYPPRCDDAQAPQINCIAFHRPEWRDAAAGGGAFDTYRNRIHSGLNAQKYFTFYSIHEAGMYQQVTNGIRPGSRLRFTVYMQAWSTEAAQDLTSSGQQTMNLKVGIDPFGGTDPFSPNIVWSLPGDSYDVYSQFGVEAVAQSNAVTVFTYSRPVYPLQHNDVYVDDAALVVIGSGSVQPTAVPQPTTAPVNNTPLTSFTVSNTSAFPGTTVDAKGNIIYIVQPGNTAFSLAKRFGTTVQQLIIWNGLDGSAHLWVGMSLIVGKTTAGSALILPAPTATPSTTSTVSTTTTNPYPGTTVDARGNIIYIVQPGDNTFRIALRFHTTVAQLVAWNNLASAVYIQVGQALIVGKTS